MNRNERAEVLGEIIGVVVVVGLLAFIVWAGFKVAGL